MSNLNLGANEQPLRGSDVPLVTDGKLQFDAVASYERQLAARGRTEMQLREVIAQDRSQLRHKDELLENQLLLSSESDHRLMNDLQMVVSLLSLQSRASRNPEAAAELTVAADRVATIGRIHRRLHSSDGVQTVAFKSFLDDLSADISKMLPPERAITVKAIEISLPKAKSIPLGFIVNELITNAAKHSEGFIEVALQPASVSGYALSISNSGEGLPKGFDPSSCKGLGMKIVQSFVKQIGGELQIGRGDHDRGARFTVVFC